MRGMLIQYARDGVTIPADGSVKTLESYGNTSYGMVGRTGARGERLYALFSLSDAQNAAQILRNELWVVTAALLTAAALFALLLSGMFSRPIRNITDTARALAQGRLDAQARVHSNDEIGQLADTLNELARQLQKTENLRRELLANVSHDLRSPLAVIQGYAETVRDVTWPYEAKRGEQLTVIAHEAKRLSRIVESMLDYSKLQAGVAEINPCAVDLGPALSSGAQLYAQEAAAKPVRIRVDAPEVQVLFDPMRLGSVMDNLLSNALRHAQKGSDILVTARIADRNVRISVENRGETISEKDLPHIWERYYRVNDANSGGTGLGLAIVKQILDLHGCAYGVESQNGRTVFWFEAVRM